MKNLLVVITVLLLSLQTGCSLQKAKATEQQLTLTSNGCAVLNYHRIRDGNLLERLLTQFTDNSELTTYSVYKDDFEKQMLYLKEKGVTFITPDDLVQYIDNQKEIAGKCALVTFDDIDRSVYENAYPILKRENIPFTSFIIMGEIGNPNFSQMQMITWEQLDEMKQSGLATIGTHTYQMHYVEDDSQPPFMKLNNLAAFQTDAEKAKQVYKDHFGEDPKYFAYPYGYGIPETDEAMLQKGYQLLFSLNGGLVTPGSPHHYVNRILVEENSWKVIKAWVDGN